MLGKVSSGSGGICEYLETGRKAGREYDRDLIDERVTMDGDMVLLDEAINSIETRNEGDAKYLHISLSFAERFTESENPGPGEINMAMMQKALTQYRNDLMAAYEPDEYVFYAEAHIPKVTHDVHARTGEVIERLPHIHVVIPLRNVATDQYMNPLGYGEMNIPFHDAIQEKINNDLGLKSPDDAPRQQKAEPALDRHTDRPGPTTAKELRETFNRAADEGQFKSIDDVAEFAKQFGETKIRHGKHGDYVNITPEWSAKGINLSQFTPEKLAGISDALAQKKDLGKERSVTKTAETVEHWRERRALEVRHVSSKGRRAAYKALDEEGKREWLEGRRNQSRALLQQKLNRGTYGRTAFEAPGRNGRDARNVDPTKSDDRNPLYADPFSTGKTGNERPGTAGDLPAITETNRAGSAGAGRSTKRNIGEANHGRKQRRDKPRVAKVGRVPPPQRIHHLSDLSELDVVRIDDELEVLLPGDVSGDLGIKQTSVAAGLRRLGDRPGAGGIDFERTELANRISQIGKRQTACLSLLEQSGAALESLDGLEFKADAIGLATRGISSALAADVQRFSERPKNIERQKSVIHALKPVEKALMPDHKLKADTSPALVLAAAQRLYGINPDDYAIGAGKDGTPRIFHENKQYNLGDFFTKHLEKPWQEARPVLVDCYKATLADALPPPDKALWLKFNGWRSQSFAHRNEARDALRNSLQKETMAVRESFKKQKTEAYKVRGERRHTLLAEARANRIGSMERISQERKEGYESLKAPGRNVEYRLFLNSLAEGGDVVALAELRRIAKVLPEEKKDFIYAAKSKTTFPLPNYSVNSRGDVVYKDQGSAVVKDSRDGVQVLTADQRSYDLALKVAVSRYGSTFTLSGDQKFKEQMVEAAKRSGMKITMRDSDSVLKTPIRINHEKGMER